MSKNILFVNAVIIGFFLMVSDCLSANVESDSKTKIAPTEFSESRIFVEHNTSDGDIEVVVIAKAGDVGLKYFALRSPTGRVVYEVTGAIAERDVGAREIVIESPEPTKLANILNAYPEGHYEFHAIDIDGKRYLSTEHLSHQLLPAAKIGYPTDESNVAVSPLVLAWNAPSGTEYVIIELENDELQFEIEAILPASIAEFPVPPAWLTRGKTYEFGISAISENGNQTVREIEFYVR